MYYTLNLFGNELPLYGILFFSGIILSVFIGTLLIKKTKLEFFDFAGCAVYTMIGAFLGAKLLFVAVSIKEIIRLKLTLTEIVKGGFVFYGGLIGGTFGTIIYAKQFKINAYEFLDLFATVLPLGHAFGRIGCFYSGCCYGIAYDGIFSHVYHTSANLSTPLGVPLLPVQLIESAFLFILFFVLLITFIKTKRKGLPAFIYMLSYSVARFILEFYRGDLIRGIFLGLSTSQWISLVLFVTSFLFLTKKKT